MDSQEPTLPQGSLRKSVSNNLRRSLGRLVRKSIKSREKSSAHLVQHGGPVTTSLLMGALHALEAEVGEASRTWTAQDAVARGLLEAMGTIDASILSADADDRDGQDAVLTVVHAQELPLYVLIKALHRGLGTNVLVNIPGISGAQFPMQSRKISRMTFCVVFAHWEDDSFIADETMRLKLLKLAKAQAKVHILYGPWTIPRAIINGGEIEGLLKAADLLRRRVWYRAQSLLSTQECNTTWTYLRNSWSEGCKLAEERCLLSTDESAKIKVFSDCGRIYCALELTAESRQAFSASSIRFGELCDMNATTAEDELSQLQNMRGVAASQAQLFEPSSVASYTLFFNTLSEFQTEHSDLPNKGVLFLEAARNARVSQNPKMYLHWSKEAYELLTETHGENHSLSIEAHYELGRAKHYMGYFDEAIFDLWAVENLLKELQGEEAPLQIRAHVLIELAEIYLFLAAFEDVDLLVDQAMDILSQIEQENELDKAKCVLISSNLLRDRGLFEECHRLAQEALELVSLYTSPTSALRLEPMVGIAAAKRGLFKHGAALMVLESAREIVNSSIGETHPDSFGVLMHLGQVLSRREFNSKLKAMQMLRDLRQHSLLTFSTLHPRSQLAAACVAESTKDSAELLSVIHYFEELLGANHYRVAHFRALHANMLPDPESSIEENFQALTIYEKYFPGATHHPSMGVIMFNIAHRYDRLGKYDEAFVLMSKVVKTFEECYSPDHPNMLRAYSFYQDMTRYSDFARRQTRAIN